MHPLRFLPIWLGLIFGGSMVLAQIVMPASPELTRIQQLTSAAGAGADVNYSIHLEGVVLWADPQAGKLVLQDGSGVAELELDWRNPSVRPGQLVRVAGNGTITHLGGSYRLGVHGPVVDNDGVHWMQEKSGAVYLAAGRHPLRVEWFNGVEKYGLDVEYSGPGLPRQKIPDASLFRPFPENPDDPNALINGLNYECFAVPGEVLPEAASSLVLTRGVTAGFDLGVKCRAEHVGLRFSGFIAVSQAGLYKFYTRSDDGSRLFIDAPSLSVTVTGQAELPAPRPLTLGQRLDGEYVWAQVTGTVTFAGEHANGLTLELHSDTGRMRVEIADATGLSSAALLNHQVRMVGVAQGAYTTDGQQLAGTLLVSGAENVAWVETSRAVPQGMAEMTNALAVLTTAGEVHRLKREAAQSGYQVKIQGVVTCVLPEHQAFTLQDATRGLYVEDHAGSLAQVPRPGDFMEIQGTTDPSLFAPIVKASQLTSLGGGQLPVPVRPTWDQLLTGSLDAQYVEVQGIITAVSSNGVTLLLREGRIKLELRVPGVQPAALEHYENALVRVRGCLFANWDYVTHEVKPGEIRIYGAEISVDQPAPADLFTTPAKTAAELLQFDPQAGVFQRVKVAGQILHARDAEYFMTDGKSGLRFIVKKPEPLTNGDWVEVVGFPELSGAAPVLREAVVRKTDHAPLPPCRDLTAAELVHAGCDATLVRVRGVLVSVRESPAEQVLEIQNGVRTFVARLPGEPHALGSLPVGCQLELTGVYAGQGGNQAVGQDVSSFELLLNAPADLRVLARPPWWTLERLLFIMGALACVLAVTVLWITQLHRQVEQRTAELEIQIKERQRVEQQRLMEQERARVAQDLHDELGSSLTEISMLGARARAAGVADETRRRYLDQMTDKAREMVAALDEIVWAMNPRHDSLASLVSYFGLYADRFLGLAGVAWRLEDAAVPPDFVVDSRHRHQLFLAFKEALTNIVRHAHATEVRLRIGLEAGELRLVVADNGRGLPDRLRTEEMDGVNNMRIRLEKLGGRFELASEAGRGTTLRFFVPAV